MAKPSSCSPSTSLMAPANLGTVVSAAVSDKAPGTPAPRGIIKPRRVSIINEAFFDWGLHKLTSLKHLSIRGGSSHLVSFPEMMLSASLTHLTIKDFPNLKCLSSKGFQDLASLEYLSICNCEKLTSFPEDGFSPSLLYLHIRRCPLLIECCKKDRGPEWFKIAHIPYVEIDYRHINEPEEENQ